MITFTIICILLSIFGVIFLGILGVLGVIGLIILDVIIGLLPFVLIGWLISYLVKRKRKK